MLKRFMWGALMLGVSASLVHAELVSYWPLDEFPNEDSTPDVVRGYDMQLVTDGLVDATNHVDGKFGKAFQFYNGNDPEGDSYLFAYEQQSDDDLLPINLQPEFSISMWAKVKGTGQNDWRLFSESNTLGNNDPLFNIGTANNGADDSLDIYIRNNQLSTGTVNHPHTTAHPFNDEWNHVGWTYADGMHNVWINGVLDSSYPMDSFGTVDPPNINATTIGGILRGSASHWVTGIIDDVAVWNEVLAPNQMAGLALELTTPQEALAFTDDVRPAVPVDGMTVLAAEITNLMYSESVEGQGLSQFWYDGNMRPGGSSLAGDTDVGGVDAFFEARDAGPGGTDFYPLLNPDGLPIRTPGTWWAGADNPSVVSGAILPRYPDQIAGQITGGNAANHNQYGVILQGEIFIPENGEYYLRDGIDDFAMVAVDQDGNGELDSLSADVIFPEDAGQLGIDNGPIGDVIVLDDDWANVRGGGQDAQYNGIATFEDIDAGGEWRSIEVWMAENGGGDSGILYMGRVDDPDIFDPNATGDLSQEERDAFMVRPDQLRGVGVGLTGADASAKLSEAVEYIVEVGTDGNDQFSVDDNGGLYNTSIDVWNALIRIEAGEGIEDGTQFTLFAANSIVGDDSLTLLFEDESKWSYANGILTYGEGPGTCGQGDLDGNGTVEFADFLILSGAFGQEVATCEEGDIDRNGTVDFTDFLTLSGNFGQSVGGAQAVPEPAGFALFALAGLMLGYLRPRRK